MDSAGNANVNKATRVLRRGRVVDSAGQPVAGAMVSVVWGTSPTMDIGRQTNKEGAFQVGLEAGLYRLQAIKSEVTGEVEVEGGAGDEIVITLPT